MANYQYLTNNHHSDPLSLGPRHIAAVDLHSVCKFISYCSDPSLIDILNDSAVATHLSQKLTSQPTKWWQFSKPKKLKINDTWLLEYNYNDEQLTIRRKNDTRWSLDTCTIRSNMSILYWYTFHYDGSDLGEYSEMVNDSVRACVDATLKLIEQSFITFDNDHKTYFYHGPEVTIRQLSHAYLAALTVESMLNTDGNVYNLPGYIFEGRTGRHIALAVQEMINAKCSTRLDYVDLGYPEESIAKEHQANYELARAMLGI